MKVADLRLLDVPFTFEVAAISDPWESQGKFNVFEYLPGVTFTPHDEDRFACICEDPLRPYRGCPAHRGRAKFMERAGLKLGGWRR